MRNISFVEAIMLLRWTKETSGDLTMLKPMEITYF